MHSKLCNSRNGKFAGFPEFMRVLLELLDEIDNLHVVIAGADRCAYSCQHQHTMEAETISPCRNR